MRRTGPCRRRRAAKGRQTSAPGSRRNGTHGHDKIEQVRLLGTHVVRPVPQLTLVVRTVPGLLEELGRRGALERLVEVAERRHALRGRVEDRGGQVRGGRAARVPTRERAEELWVVALHALGIETLRLAELGVDVAARQAKSVARLRLASRRSAHTTSPRSRPFLGVCMSQRASSRVSRMRWLSRALVMIITDWIDDTTRARPAM